jgi:hypothetical protein
MVHAVFAWAEGGDVELIQHLLVVGFGVGLDLELLWGGRKSGRGGFDGGRCLGGGLQRQEQKGKGKQSGKT